ncbi:hypothetical protein CO2235_MP40130 [Cupriavidus oxalaticus]|uniref:Uncharacterized protein n=1 Tax=Cupriavidus oxalaticus TaxID=96344 RepID=A0A976GCU3_9BURK|nr:hypothetical protein CO2235_MP40130 [Cupriavidus oxalaticus]
MSASCRRSGDKSGDKSGDNSGDKSGDQPPQSFPRRREPSDFKRRWIPAFAGMTVGLDTLTERH